MAGVFCVAAELAKRGFIVAPTSRSARGPDLLATSPETGKNYAIQVKTSGKKQYLWRLSKYVDEDVSPNLLYVFVILEGKEGTPDFFVVPSKVVSKEKWIKPSSKFPPTFSREKAEAYQNKWGQFK